MKICSKCKAEKPSAEYSVRSASNDGLCSQCRACRVVGSKASYEKHKERALAGVKAYKAANKEKVREWARDREKTPIGRLAKKRSKQRRRSRDAVLRAAARDLVLRARDEAKEARRAAYAALMAGWAATRAERKRAKERYRKSERRAKKLRATPKWADKSSIKRIYLESIRRNLQVDHIVPLRSPLVCGLHCEANLQLLCAEENYIKNNRYWPDMP